MSTASNRVDIYRVLLLSPIPIPEIKFSHFIKVFLHATDLIAYVERYHGEVDTFQLHIPSAFLEELMGKAVGRFNQFRCLYIYYEDNEALQSDRNRFAANFKNMIFCRQHDLKKHLEKAETGGAVDPSRPIDDTALGNVNISITERVSVKRTNEAGDHPSEPKRFASTGQTASSMTSGKRGAICSSCNLFLQNPYELACAHWYCRSCLNIQKKCSKCSTVISKVQVQINQDFQKEIHGYYTKCLICKWEGSHKFYKEHDREHLQQIGRNDLQQMNSREPSPENNNQNQLQFIQNSVIFYDNEPELSSNVVVVTNEEDASTADENLSHSISHSHTF